MVYSLQTQGSSQSRDGDCSPRGCILCEDVRGEKKNSMTAEPKLMYSFRALEEHRGTLYSLFLNIYVYN